MDYGPLWYGATGVEQVGIDLVRSARQRSIGLGSSRVNWKTKAALKSVFSSMPFGEQLDYLCQRHVTKRLPASREQIVAKASQAMRHVRYLRQYGCPTSGLWFEFGAGWDLAGPLSMYGLGISSQIVADLNMLIRRDLINRAIQGLATVAEFSRPIQPLASGDLVQALKRYGIDYRAPYDAGNTGLADKSVDVIINNEVFEHVPESQIRRILVECHRILKDDGAMSLTIDYTDHYAHTDSSIPTFNFLQYDEAGWKRYNPPLHYQNRCRHKDYLEVLESVGFVPVFEACKLLSEDYGALKRMRLAKHFQKYNLNDLAVRYSHLVLRKADRHASAE
jgi:hypothetical protein